MVNKYSVLWFVKGVSQVTKYSNNNNNNNDCIYIAQFYFRINNHCTFSQQHAILKK